MTTTMRAIGVVGLCGALLVSGALVRGATVKFLSDDPLSREPDTQDASGVKEWEIDLTIDLAINLFGRPGDATTGQRARNVNTIDEVPDSSWFTNRILARPLTLDELSKGPLTGAGPAPGTWSVVSPKLAGFAPGFTMLDAKGDRWFVSFDAAGHPEAATGAIAVANRIFWALGYWQVENHLVSVHARSTGHRRYRDLHAARRDASGRCEPRDLDAVSAARSSQRRWHAIARSPPAPCRAVRSADSSTTAPGPTIRMTSCRTSIAASCARSRCSARGPTSST